MSVPFPPRAPPPLCPALPVIQSSPPPPLLAHKLFNRENWHPKVEGGGMHWNWGREDGNNVMHIDADGKLQPDHGVGWGNIDYGRLRAKVINTFRPIQNGLAAQVVALVQDYQNRVYQVSPPVPPPPPIRPLP